jgi:stage III sporulation protein SpoIIIAA
MKNYDNNLDDIYALVAILPERLSFPIHTIGIFDELVEIVLDVGRPPLRVM